MPSGRRIVVLIFVVAAAFAAVMLTYAIRTERTFEPELPDTAARETLEASNTVVGLLGGIRRVDWRDEREIGREAVAMRADVVGARDSGRYYVDLDHRDGHWRVDRAAFVLSDGRRLPIRGERPPALEPGAER